jgi:hypothetical protein
VHEVQPLPRHAGEQGVVLGALGGVDHVPAEVGHDGAGRQPFDRAGQQAEAGLVALLGAGVEQLHPDADAEHRALVGDEAAHDVLEAGASQARPGRH